MGCIYTALFSKCFTILPKIHPFMHTFTHRRRSQPRKETASSSGAVRARRLAQGHLDTQLGGAGDRTSDLRVTNQSALRPGPHTGHPRRADAGEGVGSVDAPAQPAGVGLTVVHVHLTAAPREAVRTLADVRPAARHGLRPGDTGAAVPAAAGGHKHLAAVGWFQCFSLVQLSIQRQECSLWCWVVVITTND